MKFCLVFLLIFTLYSPSESLNLRSLGQSTVDVVTGVAKKIPDVIPSPEDLFQTGKNLIAGYPFEKVTILSSFFVGYFRNLMDSKTWLLTPVYFARYFRSSIHFVSEKHCLERFKVLNCDYEQPFE